MGADFPFDYSGYLFNIFILIIILVALFYLSHYIKNKGLIKPFKILKSTSYIKILDRQFLEQRKGLYLINIGSRYWFIGTSENGIHVIDEVKSQELSSNLKQEE